MLRFAQVKKLCDGRKVSFHSKRMFGKRFLHEFIEINPELSNCDKPIVALESTIITHGMPYPTNLEMALEVENEIARLNVMPATIGWLNGRLKVGLSKDEIELLAKNTANAIKISRRDLPYLYSNQPNRPRFGGRHYSYDLDHLIDGILNSVGHSVYSYD
jgi:hypothetical protein